MLSPDHAAEFLTKYRKQASNYDGIGPVIPQTTDEYLGKMILLANAGFSMFAFDN